MYPGRMLPWALALWSCESDTVVDGTLVATDADADSDADTDADSDADTDADSDADTDADADTGPALPAPDWSLADVNDTSPTFGQQVSPRDQLLKVSGWYFTHAT